MLMLNGLRFRGVNPVQFGADPGCKWMARTGVQAGAKGGGGGRWLRGEGVGDLLVARWSFVDKRGV